MLMLTGTAGVDKRQKASCDPQFHAAPITPHPQHPLTPTPSPRTHPLTLSIDW